MTPDVALGPSLVSTRVKVTISPTFGVGLSTLMSSERSALGEAGGLTVTSALSALLDGSGSSSLPATTALLEIEPETELSTVTAIVKVALPLTINEPTEQTTTPLFSVQPAVALPNETLTGSVSVMVTPVAAAGPLLLTTRV